LTNFSLYVTLPVRVKIVRLLPGLTELKGNSERR